MDIGPSQGHKSRKKSECLKVHNVGLRESEYIEKEEGHKKPPQTLDIRLQE